jgi:hypothetical protein
MTHPLDEATTTPANERPARSDRPRRPRALGFRSADILRTAALVIAIYFLAQLVRFAHPLFLTAFLGILFGLAVSAGVDVLSRWRLPRGVSAALIVITFFGLLFGFGARWRRRCTAKALSCDVSCPTRSIASRPGSMRVAAECSASS